MSILWKQMGEGCWSAVINGVNWNIDKMSDGKFGVITTKGSYRPERFDDLETAKEFVEEYVDTR